VAHPSCSAVACSAGRPVPDACMRATNRYPQPLPTHNATHAKQADTLETRFQPHSGACSSFTHTQLEERERTAPTHACLGMQRSHCCPWPMGGAPCMVRWMHDHAHACIRVGPFQEATPVNHRPSSASFRSNALPVGPIQTDTGNTISMHDFHFVATTKFVVLQPICMPCGVRCSMASSLTAIKWLHAGQLTISLLADSMLEPKGH
jgi:hypothetical protein